VAQDSLNFKKGLSLLPSILKERFPPQRFSALFPAPLLRCFLIIVDAFTEKQV
jgi:hypothetical protein